LSTLGCKKLIRVVYGSYTHEILEIFSSPPLTLFNPSIFQFYPSNRNVFSPRVMGWEEKISKYSTFNVRLVYA
jgi:hypothetical protein